MNKCIICENHQRTGKKHTCSKCETKIIYGVLQEPFIECCQYFTMTKFEKQRRAYLNKIKERACQETRAAAEVKGNEKNIHKRKNNRQPKL